MIVVWILSCEVSFWILTATGLACRFWWRRACLGAALLTAVPVVDVVLLVLTAVDLRRGASPDAAHGLAAVYVGFSVALGPDVIRHLDRRLAARGARAEDPVELHERARRQWRSFWLAGLAALISVVLLLAETAIADGARAQLQAWVPNLGAVLVVWLLSGPVPATVRARRTATHPTPGPPITSTSVLDRPRADVGGSRRTPGPPG